MTNQQKETIRECAEAARLHVTYMQTLVNGTGCPLSDVIEGQEISATKLEMLLKEEDEASVEALIERSGS